MSYCLPWLVTNLDGLEEQQALLTTDQPSGPGTCGSVFTYLTDFVPGRTDLSPA